MLEMCLRLRGRPICNRSLAWDAVEIPVEKLRCRRHLKLTPYAPMTSLHRSKPATVENLESKSSPKGLFSGKSPRSWPETLEQRAIRYAQTRLLSCITFVIIP